MKTWLEAQSPPPPPCRKGGGGAHYESEPTKEKKNEIIHQVLTVTLNISSHENKKALSQKGNFFTELKISKANLECPDSTLNLRK